MTYKFAETQRNEVNYTLIKDISSSSDHLNKLIRKHDQKNKKVFILTKKGDVTDFFGHNALECPFSPTEDFSNLDWLKSYIDEEE